MPDLFSYILRNKKLHGYLRRKYSRYLATARSDLPVEASIPEASPIDARASSFHELRLNLLVPALANEHVFGGISTALAFLKALSGATANIRIVLTESANFSHADNSLFNDWTIAKLEEECTGGCIITPAGDRYGKTLSVGPNDRFIATAWWTAVSARNLQILQQRLFALDAKRPYVYLIQDYEPGFYPWSSRYALAESTYRHSDDFIAVFNTSILRDFFIEEGYRFKNIFYFEPVLNERLRPFLKCVSQASKEKKILVYGRPGVERNGFPLVVMALRLWVQRNSEVDWTFVSAGEMHAPIDLGKGCRLISVGKLSLEGYAKVLTSSYAGISLMISPHPSYPPLEMAAFNVQVVTNRYKSKDLAPLSSNIVSVTSASPDDICSALTEITSAYPVIFHGTNSEPVTRSMFFEGYCSDTDPFAAIAGEVSSLLSRDSPSSVEAAVTKRDATNACTSLSP